MKRLAALLLGSALALGMALPARADQTEDQIGQQVYQELSQRGEIIQSSPYYTLLTPLAKRIKAIADPQYDRPFQFILVHAKQPNAFAVPGGNVYVTDSLLRFVQNQEELAGVLCHETSHTIHHDVVNNMRKDQQVSMLATGLSLLLGGGKNAIVNNVIGFGANAKALNFSREVETAADLKGSDTCAQAGFNPNGMVWLFEQFEKADTGGRFEMLSDHPRDDHRISDLVAHMKANPARFRRFSPDISSATALPGWVKGVKSAYGPDPTPPPQ